MAQPEIFDAIVVGSGAGGGPLALELTQAGARVLVLEKGRALSRDELIHDEVKFCRSNFLVPSVSDEPHVLVRHGRSHPTADGWIACCVGGGTVHMSGFFLRLKPDDFRMHTLFGDIPGATLADWPISYADLAPYYDRVEHVIGVSGRAGVNPFEEPRTGPFPMPALEEHLAAQEIDRVCHELGYHAFPTPRAILSVPRGDRGSCTYCALCAEYGCETGAKGSTADSVLPAAVATGKCEIRARCMVHTIEIDRRGRATGAVYFDERGEEQRALGRSVVLSCSAIESVRLLLNSKSTLFPDGLGNHSGMVGKNAIFSHNAGAFARFDRSNPDSKPPWVLDRAPFVHRCVQDFYKNAAPGCPTGGTLSFLIKHPNPIASGVREASLHPILTLGIDLKRQIRRNVRDSLNIGFEVFGEFIPNPETFISLDPTVRDKWGIPVARIAMEPHPLDRTAVLALQEKGLQILNALGPAEVTPRDESSMLMLQHGGCRFGTNPESSVLNRDCRSHSVPNLWVVDGSFIPTFGGVPPTWTIMANSFRVGELMGHAFRRREVPG